MPDATIPVHVLVPALAAEGLDMSRYLFACLVVLGLLCLGAFALARLQRTSLVQRAKKRSLRVLDVLPIGRKQRLCVVRAYDRTFVLGVGEREVALVAELDQDDDLAAEALALAEREAKSPAPTSFAALLRGFAGSALQQRVPTVARSEAEQAAAPAATAPTANTAAAAHAPAAGGDVERRAAQAAREALLSILDERRSEAAARRAEKQAAGEVRRKAARTSDAPATPARPANQPEASDAVAPRANDAQRPAKPRVRPVSAPAASAAASPNAGAATTPTNPRSSWVG
jgi:flagellar biogenesis protein FliO